MPKENAIARIAGMRILTVSRNPPWLGGPISKRCAGRVHLWDNGPIPAETRRVRRLVNTATTCRYQTDFVEVGLNKSWPDSESSLPNNE